MKKCFSNDEETVSGKSADNIKTAVLSRIEEGKPMKRIKIKPLIIAAATVTVALLAGFTVATRRGVFRIGNKPAFEYNLAEFDITIPDEYKPTEENYYRYEGKVEDVGIEELFEMFNAPLLINDNFSVEIDETQVEKWHYHNETTGEEYSVSFEPFIEVFNGSVEFHYYLYDKNVGRNVLFEALYLTEQCGDAFQVRNGVSVNHDKNLYEIITLNDGSKCFVDRRGADFTYNGARYQMYTLYPDERDRDIEITKQILRDLGVM